MSKGAQWEVRLELTLVLLDEVSPHQPSCSVIWEGEVDGLGEELFEILLGSLLWLRCTTDNRDTSLVVDELRVPLLKRLLDSCWVSRVDLLLLSSLLFTALFLTRPNFFTFININN